MRIRIAGWVLITLAAGMLVPQVCATHFEMPAQLGDRRVGLEWKPDTDDPLFTGNLLVFFEGRTVIGSAEYAQILFPQFGETAWLLGRGGDAVVSLQQTTDGWVPGPTLDPVGAGVEVTCAALHPGGTLLVAGLSDGRVVVWHPNKSPVPSIYSGHGGVCTGVAFRPLAVGADSSFVTVGADGVLKQWSRPGFVRRDSLIDAAGLWAVAFDREGERAALARSDGQVDVWQVTSGFSLLRRFVGPAGRRVTGLSWSQDGRRLASADDQGAVQVWDVIPSRRIGSYEPATPSPIHIAYTPQKSGFIAYARQDGEIGVLDGVTASAYNVQRYLGRPITGFGLTPDGLVGFFGGAAGQVEWWHQGQCLPSTVTPVCFGGYIVWRGPSARPEELIKLRTYQYGDTTWPWSSVDTTRAFVDPDSVRPRGGDPQQAVAGPHNGIPFYYSLTKFNRQFLGGQEYIVYLNSQEDGLYGADAGAGPEPLVPRSDARRVAPLLGDLRVVPDPYRENDPDARFGPYSPPEIWFVHLPEVATIRIYTMNGELVRTVHHAQRAGGVSGGAAVWDLKNDHGRDVISGVYPYAVTTVDGESRTGFLTIVR
jgi:WD40 repeat protein